MLATLQALDISALEFIRTTFSFDSVWFQRGILFFSDLEPIAFWLFLLGFWFYGISSKSTGPKHVALDLFWHVMGAFTVYWIINNLLPIRPRPETVTDLPPLISHLPDNSFPSGHAMFWGASWWALHVLLARPRITLLFFTLGFITCLTRIIAGIHYPGDIIVGFFLGWWIVHCLTVLPHGKKYLRFAHDIPLRFARYFSL